MNRAQHILYCLQEATASQNVASHGKVQHFLHKHGKKLAVGAAVAGAGYLAYKHPDASHYIKGIGKGIADRSYDPKPSHPATTPTPDHTPVPTHPAVVKDVNISGHIQQGKDLLKNNPDVHNFLAKHVKDSDKIMGHIDRAGKLLKDNPDLERAARGAINLTSTKG